MPAVKPTKLINLRPQLALWRLCSFLVLVVCLVTACRPRQNAHDSTTPSPNLSPDPAMASQATPSPSPLNTDEQIETIRQQYAEFRQKLPEKHVIMGDLLGMSAEGGNFKAYLDGQTLRLITATLYGETGRTEDEFYYDADGNLFFVFRRQRHYDKPFGKPNRTVEQRFYFHAGKMIRWLSSDNRPTVSDQSEFVEQQARILTLSKTLLEKVRR